MGRIRILIVFLGLVIALAYYTIQKYKKLFVDSDENFEFKKFKTYTKERKRFFYLVIAEVVIVLLVGTLFIR